VDILLFLAIFGGIGYWVYLTAFHKGKYEGSRKAYAVGRDHERYGRRIKKPF
jgi:hypothetical protein